MKTISLTPGQIDLLDTVLGLDLDAIGFDTTDQRMAQAIRKKLVEKPNPDAEVHETPASRPITRMDPLRILRLTPAFRHEDK